MEYPIKHKAFVLRRKGKTYAEINKMLRVAVPRSTYSYWFKDLKLSAAALRRIASLNTKNLARSRAIVLANRARMRNERARQVAMESLPLLDTFKGDMRARKLVLATLYLAEGSKTDRRSVMFGNSNPATVRLFVNLLRSCYEIDESKFRATVQCRADQNTLKLRQFWSDITGISKNQFYKAHIDARSVGKPTKKLHYKGVCRIDYFSAYVDFDLKYLAREIEKVTIN